MTMEAVKRFLVAEDRGGHDGAANGGHFGAYTELFGIFPDGAVVVGAEKEGAIHTAQYGHTLNQHHDKAEWSYSYDASALRPGDFIAVEQQYDGLVNNSSGGHIKILAHRLPIGADIPTAWEAVGGKKESTANGYGEITTWLFVKTRDGSQLPFGEVAKGLGLKEIVHPFGKLWLSGDSPVAITDQPVWSNGRSDRSDTNEIIRGDRNFFAAKGFAVLEFNDKNTYYGAGDYYTCTVEVVRRDLPSTNLREEGWYPVEVKDEMVVWGTGLVVYPKHLEWQIGLDKASGSTEDPHGTRIFDSSSDRLERVREFFKEALGVPIIDPRAEYLRWANASDPRGGKWRNHHHYPEAWTPHFGGWDLSRFSGVECRWKLPKIGAARFYGLVRKAQHAARPGDTSAPFRSRVSALKEKWGAR